MLNRLFINLLSYIIPPVYLAKTQKEKEAIYRFRYQVYIVEMNITYMDHIDHANKMLFDDLDNEPNTYLFYVGSSANILGTTRLKIWPHGEAPFDIKQKYRTDLFSHFDKIKIAEISYLLIKKKWRARWIALNIYLTLQRFILEQNIDLVFCNCLPGLVKYYQKMGFRIYSSTLIPFQDALSIPLVNISYDVIHFKKIKSILFPFIEHYISLHPITNEKQQFISTINKQLILIEKCIYIDEDERKEIEKKYYKNFEQSYLLKHISLNELNKLSSIIFQCEKNQIVYSAGMEDKDIFFILEGEYEVFRQEKICVLKPGDLFGEMAFFLDSGKRSTSIKAVTSGKVLIIRRNDIIRCMRENATLSSKFLFAMAQILSIKLKNTTDKLIGESDD